MVYDAIVVGAGPAGAVLGYELARRGLQVLILEKARLPRHKPCGGGLPLKTVRALPFDASPALDLEMAGGILTYGGQFLLRADVPHPFGWMVMRDRFDHFLALRAVEAGAGLADGVAVRSIAQGDGQVGVDTARGRFAARLLAGADGVNSVVARACGLLPRRQAGMAIEAEVAVPAAELQEQGPWATFDFGALPHGYGWVFPKSDHLSVGLFHARPGKVAGLKGHLERFMAGQPVLRDSRVLRRRGHLIPLGGRRDPLHSGRVLLVGDAANLADAWLGEGVYYAIVSARMAAEAIAAALTDGPSALAGYTARVHAEIVPQLRHARYMAGFVYRMPRFGSHLLRRSRRMQQVVFGAMRGDWTLREMNVALVRQLPRILSEARRA